MYYTVAAIFLYIILFSMLRLPQAQTEGGGLLVRTKESVAGEDGNGAAGNGKG